jgi:hypothetical protein
MAARRLEVRDGLCPIDDIRRASQWLLDAWKIETPAATRAKNAAAMAT